MDSIWTLQSIESNSGYTLALYIGEQKPSVQTIQTLLGIDISLCEKIVTSRTGFAREGNTEYYLMEESFSW